MRGQNEGMKKDRLCGLAIAWLVTVAVTSLSAQTDMAPQGWRYFGGNKAFMRYAPLDQVHKGNVGELSVLWRRAATDPAFTARFPAVSYTHLTLPTICSV